MAFRLDSRYLLLAERSVSWLDKAYDGWDEREAKPVTAGYFEAAEGPPLLPLTLRLQHPNVLTLLDIRADDKGGVWAVWDHFGPAGADGFEAFAIPSAAAVWVAHEATNALLYARGALGRSGGFRMADFSAEHIRLYEDGTVRVVGFGRLAQERDEAGEFARLGSWTGSWLAHSSHEGTETDETATVAAEVITALSTFGSADSQPLSAAPRILTGLRTGLVDGDEALARHVQSLASPQTGAQVEAEARDFLADAAAAPKQIFTTSLVPAEDADEAVTLPRVTIAPAEPTVTITPAPREPKGIPRVRRKLFPIVVVALMALLLLVSGWRFRWLFSIFGGDGTPQIRLTTSPSGATVHLDGSLLSEVTPLDLNDLSVGWHRLAFTAAEFPPLVDSFLVYKAGAHRPVHFVFTRPIRIESRPPGAVVYENGKRAARTTPFLERDWPVSAPLSLVMHLESYGSIEDCLLDPVFGTVEVKDPAAWTVDRRGDTLVVRGFFVHSVSFFASPPDCRLLIDDTLAVDPTGGSAYPLTFGAHEARAEAVGFDPLDTSFVISGQSPPQISLVLSRPVRIGAIDPRWPEADLRALVDRLDGPERTLFIRRFTPYSVRIPALAFTATLRKRGYRDTTVYVPPDLSAIQVYMTPAPTSRVSLLEPPDIDAKEQSRLPATDGNASGDGSTPWVNIEVSVPDRRALAGAEIWARQSGGTSEHFLGTTDQGGRLRAQIPVGNYDLLAYLDGFSGVRKRVKVRPARNRPVVIDLNR